MAAWRQQLGRALSHRPSPSPFKLGVVVIVAILLAVVGLSQMERIKTWVRPTDTVRVNFAKDYRLQELVSEVKVAGVPVGVVQSVERAGDGTAIAELEVDEGVTDTLGAAPRAAIRPTTILGGKYYVELVPGGRAEPLTGTIPVERTRVPVEVQQVISALQPDAITGIRSSTRALDETLNVQGRKAIENLLADAPNTLRPASAVLQGMQGTHPETDLPNLVHGLESTAHALNRNEGELASIVQNMDTVSGVLDNRSAELAATIQELPETFDATNRGLDRLERTLDKLRETSDPVRPVVRELDTTLAHLDPVLAKSRPLLADLRTLLRDARPLVEQLVPTTRGTTSVLNDVRGPVLDRINGPIKQMVRTPFTGTGVYAGGGSAKPVYQELAYMFADMDRASQMVDENGTAVGLQPGFGGALVSGTPINLEQLLDTIGQIKGGTPEQREGR